MTKFERAMEEAAKLPDDMREELGEDLLHYIHKYLALCDDLDMGIRDADEGRVVDGDAVFDELKARYGS